MKQSVAVIAAAFLWSSTSAYAGVVMDMVTLDASGTETDRTKIYAQSRKIRMDQGNENPPAATMIFLGDHFLYVDHREKSYIVMDEAMLDQVSAKMNEAMKEMEAQLADMPPEQRAMVEQMMKGQMQGMMPEPAQEAPPIRVDSTGRSEWKGRKCREYAVFEGGVKTQQLCAADLDDVEGSEEVIEAFRNMAAYMTKMNESMPMRSEDRSNPGELMEQIDGFPVHTVDYENGVMVGETSLDSVVEQDLDEAMFAAPDGYRQEDPFGGR